MLLNLMKGGKSRTFMFSISILVFSQVQRLQQFVQTTCVAEQSEKLPGDQGDSFHMYCIKETQVVQIFDLQNNSHT